ncbi:hypothetical protein BMR06_14720 [Methylococcaceae bacterium HT5]|nr:hypothetical protein BMR06_14720 [Methylococcaceae bacterium HT5]
MPLYLLCLIIKEPKGSGPELRIKEMIKGHVNLFGGDRHCHRWKSFKGSASLIFNGIWVWAVGQITNNS